MDEITKKRLDCLIADEIRMDIFGKSERGYVLHFAGKDGKSTSWNKELEELGLKEHPEKAREAADYFISVYQKMGEQILEDPSFVLNDENPEKNWEKLLSPQSFAVKAIENTVGQLVEMEPSLKKNLQDYMEEQIREQISHGNKVLEIGYLFAKEPFSPENRAYKKREFEELTFTGDLYTAMKEALKELTGDKIIDIEDNLKWDEDKEIDQVLGEHYIYEPKQAEYRLKKVVEEEIRKREQEEAARRAEQERIEKARKEEEERQKAIEKARKEEEKRQKEIEKARREELEKQRKQEQRTRNFMEIQDDAEPDFDPDLNELRHSEKAYIAVDKKMVQTYFQDALGKLQDEAYEENPVRYTERLIKMQMLVDYHLILNPEDTKAFQKEKDRIFGEKANENLIGRLIEQQAKLYQKRGEMEESGETAFEAVDYQLEALEHLTKGYVAYDLIAAEQRNLSAYPLFEKGMKGYQALQTEAVQNENISFVSKFYQYFDHSAPYDNDNKDKKDKDDKEYRAFEKNMQEKSGGFMEAFGNLDRSEEEKQKPCGDEADLRVLFYDGIKANAEKWLQEKRQAEQQRQQQEQMQAEHERQFDRHVSEEELDAAYSPYMARLATLADDLSKSVRKGVFGGKKENSEEYEEMRRALDVLLVNPVHEEPTLQDKEHINHAYEICRAYTQSHARAKTSEGKRRLALAEEAEKLLEEMNPELKERQRERNGNRERISFRDLEGEGGRGRDQAEAVRRENQRERTNARENRRER